MNNLLKLSLIVRKLTLKSYSVRPVRFIRTSSYCKGEWLRGDDAQTQIPKSHLVTPENNCFPLPDRLKACHTYNQVFYIIRTTGERMDGVSAKRVFQTLYRISQFETYPHIDVLKKEEFSMLCDILKNRIKDLSVHDMMKCLKILMHFRVPFTTAIIHLILERITNSLDDKSVQDMTNLCTSPKLDTENIDNILVAPQHVHMESNSKNLLSHFLNAWTKLEESSINPEDAKQVMEIILNMDSDDALGETVRKCQRVLLNSIDARGARSLHSIVRTITCGVTRSPEVWYNDSFLDACAMSIISRDMGVDTAVLILEDFNLIRHVHISLLDYIAAKCFDKKDVDKHFYLAGARTIIKGMSIADYKPVFWDIMKDMLLTDDLLQLPLRYVTSIGIDLAVIDYYWPKLLAKVFQSDMSVRRRHPKLRSWKVMMLQNAVKSYYPEYHGPWISDIEKMFGSRMKPARQIQSSVRSALECALGGPQYVLNNLDYATGFHIDHAVIMRRGGRPIAFNISGERIPLNVEDLKPPKDSQVILLSTINIGAWTRNSGGLVGFHSLIVRTLKSQFGYTMIPIHPNMWNGMTESEQVRYISQAIRLKCDELSAVLNW